MTPKKIDLKHKDLYGEIPHSEGCHTGCNACCGPVPITPFEAKELGLSENETTTPFNPITLMCSFSSNDGCKVYDKRPFMCRVFSSSEEPALKCPNGAISKNPLSTKRTQVLTNKYRKLQQIQIKSI
ncbi:TPA: hypothetical protein I7730_00510 [Vibrio vulnificus]|uniref:YkgJ family cysteine cluster protein n=1 Tax=Vibrio vulnificus TaxID=672 RepID=A0A8H9K549_VIBVL|nr:hypothetical protein [Vibrio vulnificus]